MSRLLLLLVAGWLSCAGAPARAGGFSVTPTTLPFAVDRGVSSVVLTNTSAQTLTVESQVVVPDGAEGQQANDVVVTPAVVTLPPGERARVRVGLTRRGDGRIERAYRLYFTELPAPSPLQNAGIGVRLRVGVPVFVAPQQADPAPLRWRAGHDAEGTWLEAANPGNVHARVVNVALLQGGQSLPLSAPMLHVIAGGRMRVALPNGIAAVPGARVRWQDGDETREGALALP